jgi:hypothetical protein
MSPLENWLADVVNVVTAYETAYNRLRDLQTPPLAGSPDERLAALLEASRRLGINWQEAAPTVAYGRRVAGSMSTPDNMAVAVRRPVERMYAELGRALRDGGGHPDVIRSADFAAGGLLVQPNRQAQPALMRGPKGNLVAPPAPTRHPVFDGVTLNSDVGVLAYAVGLLEALPQEHPLRRQITDPFLVGGAKPAVVLGFADKWRAELPKEDAAAYRARDWYLLDGALALTRTWRADQKADEDRRRSEEEYQKALAKQRLEQSAEWKADQLRRELEAEKDRSRRLEDRVGKLEANQQPPAA